MYTVCTLSTVSNGTCLVTYRVLAGDTLSHECVFEAVQPCEAGAAHERRDDAFNKLVPPLERVRSLDTHGRQRREVLHQCRDLFDASCGIHDSLLCANDPHLGLERQSWRWPAGRIHGFNVSERQRHGAGVVVGASADRSAVAIERWPGRCGDGRQLFDQADECRSAKQLPMTHTGSQPHRVRLNAYFGSEPKTTATTTKNARVDRICGTRASTG